MANFIFNQKQWALILGGSSGFGLAAAKKLAAHGMSVAVIHRDRKGAMERIEQEFEQVRAHGNSFISLNLDALSAEGIKTTIETLQEKLGADGKVKCLLHSIAYGNLKPIVRDQARDQASPEAHAPVLEDEDIARTVYAMGTSILTWSQALMTNRLFSDQAQVIGLTSEGNTISWKNYAAVSAAKCALESICRSIAVELGPRGIRCNVIQAGVTDSPALRLIPGNDKLKASALNRNPLGRLTLPSDVADAIFLLCQKEAAWINGALLHVDGGEHLASG